MTMLEDRPTDDAAEVRWDLEPLVADHGGWEGTLAAAEALVPAVEAHRGEIAALDAAGLRALVDRLAQIEELTDRAVSFVGLHMSTDVNDAERGRAYAAATERATAL